MYQYQHRNEHRFQHTRRFRGGVNLDRLPAASGAEASRRAKLATFNGLHDDLLSIDGLTWAEAMEIEQSILATTSDPELINDQMLVAIKARLMAAIRAEDGLYDPREELKDGGSPEFDPRAELEAVQ